MIAAMSLLAATTRAWSGRSMTRGTISAARMPRITMTTRISIRVKPLMRRKNIDNLIMVAPRYCAAYIVRDSRRCGNRGRAVASTHQLVHLENWQQDRDHEEEHDPAHRDDEEGSEQRRQAARPVHELARLRLGGAGEHGVQAPGRLAARDQVNDDWREELRRAERGRERPALAHAPHRLVDGGAHREIGEHRRSG